MPNSLPLIVGNWKMYKTISETGEFVKKIVSSLTEGDPTVYLAVPFTAIYAAAVAAKGSPISIGAQNMNDCNEGAFTGEVAGKMVKEAGASFVLLGHSERRHYFHETDEFINKKVKRAVLDGLQPLLCIGESLEEQEIGKTEEVLKSQLEGALAGLKKEDLTNLIVAYEPVWAIGTGHAATPEIAEERLRFCRKILSQILGEEAASLLPILYGGSVKPSNVRPFLEKEGIDGLLVGGASLTLESFLRIIQYNQTGIS